MTKLRHRHSIQRITPSWAVGTGRQGGAASVSVHDGTRHVLETRLRCTYNHQLPGHPSKPVLFAYHGKRNHVCEKTALINVKEHWHFCN